MKASSSPRPKASLVAMHFDFLDSQASFSDYFYADPDYPMDSYRISKPHGVSPMVTISAIYPLFPTPKKSHDLFFTNSPGIHDFYRQSSTLKTCLGCR